MKQDMKEKNTVTYKHKISHLLDSRKIFQYSIQHSSISHEQIFINSFIFISKFRAYTFMFDESIIIKVTANKIYKLPRSNKYGRKRPSTLGIIDR